MGDAHDEDADVRNELEHDLRTIRAERLWRIDGIIVSGDIAYGGQPDEFTFAEGWLESIRELVDCPKDGVMVTPGNHDVNRDLIPAGGDIDTLHDKIRTAPDLPRCDETLASILRDGTDGDKLLSSIAAYNDFARPYGCEISRARPYWERDFSLGGDGILRIRGMTSTLISGPRDSFRTHKLVYGAAQRRLMRHDRIFRAVVGHHPPSWTLEGDIADRVFSERAVIQLFGHKHEHWWTTVGKGIRLIAGAVHPERLEVHWEPRYSLIAVHLEQNGQLRIRVYPRRWTRDYNTFMADYTPRGQDFRDHVVECD